jgi:hypothetical protein
MPIKIRVTVKVNILLTFLPGVRLLYSSLNAPPEKKAVQQKD